MIKIIKRPVFQKTLDAILINDSTLKDPVKRTVQYLARNPFDSSLKTKKVSTKQFGSQWSSLVTRDIRVIWQFGDSKETTIVLLTIGSNQQPLKVYS